MHSEKNQPNSLGGELGEGIALPESNPALNVSPETKTVMGADALTGGEVSKARVQVGGTVGKYQIRSRLGVGGMGAVYLAFDPLIEREVAIKVLTPELGASSIALQRFLQEARSIGRLNHPNVVSIFDIDQWNGQYYIVMELLSGGSLAQQVDTHGPMGWREACQIVAQAAQGLGAAHQAGMVHRDVKPENLMVTREGLVKVVDFGLSKLVDGAQDTRTAVTKAGQILGTPQYMSPEQFESTDVDFRTDIYSLGATLFRLMTARFPYQESVSIVQVMTAHLTKPAPVITDFNGAVPAALNKIVARAMAKRPDDRYASATELAEELTALVNGEGRTAGEGASGGLEDDSRALKSAVLIEPSKMQGAIMKDALLRAGGEQVEVSQRGEEAIAHVIQQVPDLVMTAMELPDGRGLDVLKGLCSERLLAKSCVILHSSDSTIEDLIGIGETAGLILAPKKVRPDEILRTMHALGPCEMTQGPICAGIDPLGMRLVVVTENRRVPTALAEIIRESGLLDVVIVDAMEMNSIPEDETPTVMLMLRTAGSSAGDEQIYALMAMQRGLSRNLMGAVQVDGESLILRAVSRQGVVGVARRALNTHRLSSLLQGCRPS